MLVFASLFALCPPNSKVSYVIVLQLSYIKLHCHVLIIHEASKGSGFQEFFFLSEERLTKIWDFPMNESKNQTCMTKKVRAAKKNTVSCCESRHSVARANIFANCQDKNFLPDVS